MISAIISDFSRVILFPNDEVYLGRLNVLHGVLVQEQSEYNFFDFFHFNEELLQFYESLKPKFTLILFTEGASMQKVKEVKERMESVFEFIFTPDIIGTVKTDPRSYLAIANQIKKAPADMLFIDDRVANIKAAEKVGVRTLQFFSNRQLFDDFGGLGINTKE